MARRGRGKAAAAEFGVGRFQTFKMGKHRSPFIHLPVAVVRHSEFPFQDGEQVFVEIDKMHHLLIVTDLVSVPPDVAARWKASRVGGSE